MSSNEVAHLRAALLRIAATPTHHADAPLWYCECAVCIAVYALRCPATRDAEGEA